MVEQLDLSNEDVAIIAESVDSLIMKLVPYRSPSFRSTSHISHCSLGGENGATCKELATMISCLRLMWLAKGLENHSARSYLLNVIWRWPQMPALTSPWNRPTALSNWTQLIVVLIFWCMLMVHLNMTKMREYFFWTKAGAWCHWYAI